MSGKLKLLIMTASLALVACAGTSTDTKSSAVVRDCFTASSIRGFTAVDETTVHLQTGMRDVYELKLMSFCPDIDWSHSIGLRNRSGSSMICTQDAMGIEILMLDRGVSIGPDSCRVRSMRKLNPEEVEAQRAERKAARSKPGS